MKGSVQYVAAIVGLGLFLGLASAPTPVHAQANMSDAPPAPEEKAGSSTESKDQDQLPGVDGGQAGGTGGANRPSLDPFKALIEPKPEAPPPSVIQPALTALPPPPPPVPPVNFKVNAVAGDHPNYVAVIEFEGQTYIVQKGTKVPEDSSPAFEVKEVTAEKVTVFDMKINRLVPKQLVSDN